MSPTLHLAAVYVFILILQGASGLSTKFEDVCRKDLLTYCTQEEQNSGCLRTKWQRLSPPCLAYLQQVEGLQYPAGISNGYVQGHPRKLLNVTSGAISLQKHIPDQTLQAGRLEVYEYSMDQIFEGNYTLISVWDSTNNQKQSVASWLNFYYGMEGFLPITPCCTERPCPLEELVVSANWLFFLCNGSLLIIDISDTKNPVIAARPPLSGIETLAINGTMAYLKIGAFLHIYDFSNIWNFQHLGSAPTEGGQGNALTLDGSKAYSCAEMAVDIIDISNPTQPVRVGSYDFSYVVSFSISEEIIYIGTDSGLFMVNTTSDTMIIILYENTYYTVLRSQYLFAVSMDGFYVIDVSNPNDPIVPTTPFVLQGSFSETRPTSVAISGNIALVSDGRLHVFDISDPNNPIRLGGDYNSAWSPYVAISGNIAFALNGQGMQIFKLNSGTLRGYPPASLKGQSYTLTVAASNGISSIAEAFRLTLTDFPRPVDSVVSDQSIFPNEKRSLYLKSDQLFINPAGSFLQLTLPEGLPWTKLTLTLAEIASLELEEVHAVAISGTNAIIAYYDDVYIFDFSNPTHPLLIGQYPSTSIVAVSGTTVFLVGNPWLVVIDIEDPSNPNYRGNYSIPWYVRDIAVTNVTAFILNETSALLHIVNVSASPTLIKVFELTSNMNFAIEITDPICYVLGSKGMEILDVSDPNNPVSLGFYPVSVYDGFLGVVGDRAYLVISPFQVLVLDVSNPRNPTLLGTPNLLNMEPSDFAVSGTTLFMLNTSSPSCIVINMNDPNDPTILVDSAIPRNPKSFLDIALSGLQAVVVAGTTLHRYDLSQWQLDLAPNENNTGNFKLSLTAQDDVGGIASIPFTVRVEGPPQLKGAVSNLTAKVGQVFSYFIPQGVFSDPNFDPITYSTVGMPRWLSFNSVSAMFSGTPSGLDAGQFSFILSATDNIAGSVELTLHLFVNLTLPHIDDQQATVGEQFNYKFQYEEGNELNYTHSELPTWMQFESLTDGCRFYGVPGYSDTDFYSPRRVNITVIASNGQGQATSLFYLNVGGESWGSLAIKIAAPLLSALSTVYAGYKARALCRNRSRKSRYLKPDQRVMIGNVFVHSLAHIPRNQIHHVLVKIPTPLKKDCCHFWRCCYSAQNKLPGGARMPEWMVYDPDSNQLRSRTVVPTFVFYRQLIIQVKGEDRITLEQFKLIIQERKIPERKADDDFVVRGSPNEEKGDDTQLELEALGSASPDLPPSPSAITTFHVSRGHLDT